MRNARRFRSETIPQCCISFRVKTLQKGQGGGIRVHRRPRRSITCGEVFGGFRGCRISPPEASDSCFDRNTMQHWGMHLSSITKNTIELGRVLNLTWCYSHIFGPLSFRSSLLPFRRSSTKPSKPKVLVRMNYSNRTCAAESSKCAI